MVLNFLREQSGKWFIKTLLGAIVVSFAIWGIPDVIRSFQSIRSIAKVGSEKISAEDFSRAIHQEIDQLQKKFNTPISFKDVAKFGLPKVILNRLIDQHAFHQMVDKYGLSVPDIFVKDMVQSIPIFQKDGRFDVHSFQTFLREYLHTTEARFATDMRHNILQQQLTSALSKGMILPRFYKDSIYELFHAPHTFALTEILFSKMQLDRMPSESDLKIFYQTQKETYRRPEKRIVSLLDLRESHIWKSIPVKDEDLETLYKEMSEAELRIPEKRSLRVLKSTSLDLMKKAYKLIEKGVDFQKIPEKVKGILVEDLRSVELTSLPGEASLIVAKLPVRKHTGIITIDKQYRIYQLYHIQPSFVPTFKEIKEQLKEKRQKEYVAEFLKELVGKIDDAIASGQSLSSIAKQHNLPLLVLGPINQQGYDQAGKDILANFSKQEKAYLLDQAWKLHAGQTSSEAEWCILSLDKITPSTIPPFEEVHKLVAENFKLKEQQKKARKIGGNFLEKVKNPANFQGLAKSYGLNITITPRLSRSDIAKIRGKDEKNHPLSHLPPDFQEEIFTLPTNDITYHDIPGGICIVLCQKIEPAPLDKEAKQKMDTILDQAIGEDVIALLMQSFRKEISVTIDDKVLNEVTEHN